MPDSPITDLDLDQRVRDDVASLHVDPSDLDQLNARLRESIRTVGTAGTPRRTRRRRMLVPAGAVVACAAVGVAVLVLGGPDNTVNPVGGSHGTVSGAQVVAASTVPEGSLDAGQRVLASNAAASRTSGPDVGNGAPQVLYHARYVDKDLFFGDSSTSEWEDWTGPDGLAVATYASKDDDGPVLQVARYELVDRKHSRVTSELLGTKNDPAHVRESGTEVDPVGPGTRDESGGISFDELVAVNKEPAGFDALVDVVVKRRVADKRSGAYAFRTAAPDVAREMVTAQLLVRLLTSEPASREVRARAWERLASLHAARSVGTGRDAMGRRGTVLRLEAPALRFPRGADTSDVGVGFGNALMSVNDLTNMTPRMALELVTDPRTGELLETRSLTAGFDNPKGPLKVQSTRTIADRDLQATAHSTGIACTHFHKLCAGTPAGSAA